MTGESKGKHGGAGAGGGEAVTSPVPSDTEADHAVGDGSGRPVEITMSSPKPVSILSGSQEGSKPRGGPVTITDEDRVRCPLLP